jgi:hypothetical protein
MIEALLFAVRDNLRNSANGFDYDERSCEIMDSGEPPPRCGAIFVAVHEDSSQSLMDNALDERYGFLVTLTMRVVNVSVDRVGDQMLARKLARKRGPGGSPSFNSRTDAIRAFLHMEWGVLQDANDLIVALNPEANTLYGFVEPARYRGMETAQLVGGEWFSADTRAEDVGLKAELRFADARRLQAFMSFQ